MRNLIQVLILAASQALAVDQVTIDLTVTNIPQTGTNFVLNSDTRIWTNAHSASTILTNLVGIGPTTTNLFYNLSAYRHADLDYVYQTGTNTIRMWGKAGTAMAIGDAVTNWASWTYTTNTETKAYNIRVPHTVESATNQTNFASQLVSYLGKASNAFLKHWPAMAQFPSLTNNNAFTGTNVFVNSHSTNQNIVNAAGISGTLGALTNGVLTNTILVSPIITNGQNFGTAFRSPGSGLQSEQFGSGAVASTNYGVALGNGAEAAGISSMAIGAGSIAYETAGIAIGSAAESHTTNAIAIGTSAQANGSHSIAFGGSSSTGIDHSNSIALGTSVATTETNQIMLGSSLYKVRIPGRLEPTGTITNATFTGSSGVSIGVSGGVQTFLAVRRLNNTGLANGENAKVALNSSYVKISGPTAAFTTAGFTNTVGGLVEGQLVFIENITGYGWTIRNDSGYESIPANRIYTMNGGSDISLPGQSSATVIYDSAASRWVVLSTTPARGAYGELYTHDASQAQAITDADTYYVLTNLMSAGNSLNTTISAGAAGSTITVAPNGMYNAAYSVSAEGTASSVFTLCIFTNGVEAVNMEAEAEQTVSADVMFSGTSGLLNLTTNCIVDLRVKSDSATDTYTVHDANLSLIKIQ